MRFLELLAPARNKEIGIAAIDCGADAVYIAGPEFGARKAAGNTVADIAELCSYAHRYGTRIFVTFNTVFRDEEEDAVHTQMLQAQEAGADAFIIRDERILTWDDITVPLHASTQCAIRDVNRALHFCRIGCARIILERELSLETVRKICSAVSCEVEFFVHGALCVCYSGECRLSEKIDGRSADRGECIQACRSLYDLVDGNGKVLLRNKALLSLKDYNLKARLEDLADAGITSFKIEGRLKNASYVKNVVRDYDLALNALVDKYHDRYARASFGKVSGGFAPDTDKTFNRGYTELFLDGKRGKWSSMDAPKSMGEAIGTVTGIRKFNEQSIRFSVIPAKAGITLHNGDGFSFATGDGVTGFRGDVCEGLNIVCKPVCDLAEGVLLFRNINTAFEKALDTQVCHRYIPVSLDVCIRDSYSLEIKARSEDGREIIKTFELDAEAAQNGERAESLIRDQLSKRSEIYGFSVDSLSVCTTDGSLPFLSASAVNGMRRHLGEILKSTAIRSRRLATGERDLTEPIVKTELSYGTLMKSKYCVRYELGLCPRHQGARPSGPLYIVNNGRRFELKFDCSLCEMSVI